jgi:hypothetical protein
MLGKPGPSDYFTNEFIYIIGFYTYMQIYVFCKLYYILNKHSNCVHFINNFGPNVISLQFIIIVHKSQCQRLGSDF